MNKEWTMEMETAFKKFQKTVKELAYPDATKGYDSLDNLQYYQHIGSVLLYYGNTYLIKRTPGMADTIYLMPGYINKESDILEELERALFLFYLEEGGTLEELPTPL